MSTFPNTMIERVDRNLKLGIKSSVGHPESLLSLIYTIWKVTDKQAEIEYSKISPYDTNLIEINDELYDEIYNFFQEEVSEYLDNDKEKFRKILNKNPLVSSQIEPILVLLELIWKIAQIEFLDQSLSYSSERTGGVRYPKRLKYSINIDLLDLILSERNEKQIKLILFKFLYNSYDLAKSNKIEISEEIILRDINFFSTIISEESVFKIRDENENEILFLQEGIYDHIDKESDKVNLEDIKEDVGPLRILKSMTKRGLQYFLKIENNEVSLSSDVPKESFKEYKNRVSNYLNLVSRKNFVYLDREPKMDDHGLKKDYTKRNLILFGPPGSGKSKTINDLLVGIKNEYVFRTVFHPEYDNCDFIGSYKPTMQKNDETDEEIIAYKFIPGIFLKAYTKSKTTGENVFLIIEEINRGNCAGIFGDIFQLLDRTDEGSSEFPITPSEEIYKYLMEKDIENPDILNLPKNLLIYATMNTSDQSLFPVDSAFKRRWHWQYVPIDYKDAENIIIKLNDKKYSWRSFIEIINKKIFNITKSEDKQLGNRFVNPKDRVIDAEILIDKIMFYLWNDVFKNEDESDPNYIFKFEIINGDDSEINEFKFTDLFGKEKYDILYGFLKFNKIKQLSEGSQ